MIDNENIIREIESGEFSLVAYYNVERVIALKSSGIGALTKFVIANEIKLKKFKGLKIGDKIVGKASALLLLNFKLSFIYGSTMSENAKKVLESRGIELKYKNLVPNILGKDRIDICPMEKLILDIDSPREALDIFKELFY